MELKDLLEHCCSPATDVLNPYNGIERYRSSGSLAATTLKRIHTMELKAILVLYTPVENWCYESIQWNWKVDPLSPGTPTATISGIHTMELKARCIKSGIIASLLSPNPYNGIESSWHMYRYCCCFFEYESIQWNWKSILNSKEHGSTKLTNPYNGIERQMEDRHSH